MGRKATNGGVEVRGNSMRLHFVFNGKPCKETVYVNGVPLDPTSRGALEYARKLGARIREEMRLGVFKYEVHFPASRIGVAASTGTGFYLGVRLDDFLARQRIAHSTKGAYRATVGFWKRVLGEDCDIRTIKPDACVKLLEDEGYNSTVVRLRLGLLCRMLEMAQADGLIERNPLAEAREIKLKKSPKKRPDPFDLEEVDAILEHMRERYSAPVTAYWEVKFFTGLRTGEACALDWTQVDWKRRTLLVNRTFTARRLKLSTKTDVVREVNLNARAFAALQRHHMACGKPSSGIMFPTGTNTYRRHDHWQDRYWNPTLDALGLRFRDPYETRHTYATMLLMANVPVGLAAAQMGHSVQEFTKTYAKWIDGERNAVAIAQVDRFIAQETQATRERMQTPLKLVA